MPQLIKRIIGWFILALVILAAVSGNLAVGDRVIVADEAALLRLGEGSEVLVTKDFSP
jgi:hypothetical protein